MAVTQTDQGTSLKLVARTLLQSGRRVGISQITTTLKQWMSELGPEPEDALYNRISLAMDDKATRPEDFTVSQPITQDSARRILAAVLSEEGVTRIWP